MKFRLLYILLAASVRAYVPVVIFIFKEVDSRKLVKVIVDAVALLLLMFIVWLPLDEKLVAIIATILEPDPVVVILPVPNATERVLLSVDKKLKQVNV